MLSYIYIRTKWQKYSGMEFHMGQAKRTMLSQDHAMSGPCYLRTMLSQDHAISGPCYLSSDYCLAGCTMFSNLPEPIWQLYYFLPPVASVIPVFFHQSIFSYQSSNPFRPGEFRATSISSSRWTPFHNFFWQSSFFHSLNMSMSLKLFCFNIV